MKTYCCWRCKQWKPREAYGTRSDTGKRIYSCLDCTRDYDRAYYERRKEDKKEKARTYYEQNKEKIHAYRETRKQKDKAWNREYKLQMHYGISADAVHWMITEGLRSHCPICQRYFSANDFKRWHVDHCHTTGKIRGVICSNCNTMLGQAKDNPETLRRAARYLESNSNERANDIQQAEAIQLELEQDQELQYVPASLL